MPTMAVRASSASATNVLETERRHDRDDDCETEQCNHDVRCRQGGQW
ncbi:MAG: hypothetical protein QOI11_3069 [Candidatus Eremiobacteraeota bacterium]|jgi:hypothetical protein|nr:hypothetical protein [Candidatus Eremiobacteraeota bacterium]